MTNIPFILDKGERVLMEAGNIHFVVGESHHDNSGRLILTNKQLAISQPRLFGKEKLFAVLPLDSLVSAEPHEIGLLAFKRRGMRLVYKGPLGEMQEIRVYPPSSRGIPNREQVEKWVGEWVEGIQEAYKNR